MEALPPDVVDVLVGYLNTQDLQQLSLCSSTYNAILKVHLWDCVRVSFTELCYYQFSDEHHEDEDSYKEVKLFHNTNVLHIGCMPYQCDDVEKSKLAANVRLILGHCDLEFLHIYFNVEDICYPSRFSKSVELSLSKGFTLNADIISSWQKLDHLKVLKLPSAKITDEGFASDLPKLHTLEELDLSYCPITGTTLEYVSDLKCLKKLFLSGCTQITEDSIGWLGKLPLSELVLKGCDLGNEVLPHLSFMTYLQLLDLSSNVLDRFSSYGDTDFSGWCILRELDISFNNYLSSADVECLSLFTSLEKLSLEWKHWNTEGFECLSLLVNLSELRLYGDTYAQRVQDRDDFSWLKRLPSLKRLILRKEGWTVRMLPTIGQISSLQHLTLTGERQPNRYRNLNRLDATLCKSFGTDGLKSLKNLSQLREISIENAHKVEGSDLAPLVNLRVLNVRSCNFFLDMGYLSNLIYLSEVRFVHIGNIYPESLACFTGIPLKKLHLEDCMVSDKLIDQGIRFISSLVELKLPWNPHMTDEGVKKLCKLQLLKRVSFISCKRVGDDGILHLVPALKRLRTLFVHDTLVSKGVISTLRSQLRISVID